MKDIQPTDDLKIVIDEIYLKKDSEARDDGIYFQWTSKDGEHKEKVSSSRLSWEDNEGKYIATI